MKVRAAHSHQLLKVVALTAALVTVTMGLAGVAQARSSAAAPSATKPTTKPTRGGSITYGLEAETSGGWCIPNAQLAISGIMVAGAIYDTLTVMNAQGKYVPYLAKSVTHDPTYTQWTITLRDGIKFHDGTPLTADAVMENIDAWMRGRLLGFVYTDIASVTVNDPLSLTVTTS
ncbi:MAG: ABC transporter substrate-binding protein, partial [Acidimicrobiales bacterium]